MNDRQFRNAMGKFVTGVTVILTEVEGEAYGMTANSFMSVSLDPKLATVSIDHRASILSKITESRSFTVNILSDDQVELSKIFAGQLKEKSQVELERFDERPILPGAVANISCEVIADHIEGDHTLFIGKVTDVKLEDKNPLVFYGGKYHELLTQTITEYR